MDDRESCQRWCDEDFAGVGQKSRGWLVTVLQSYDERGAERMVKPIGTRSMFIARLCAFLGLATGAHTTSPARTLEPKGLLGVDLHFDESCLT